jgi:hypothetical protein
MKNYDGKILKDGLNNSVSEYLKIENKATQTVGYGNYLKIRW